MAEENKNSRSAIMEPLRNCEFKMNYWKPSRINKPSWKSSRINKPLCQKETRNSRSAKDEPLMNPEVWGEIPQQLKGNGTRSLFYQDDEEVERQAEKFGWAGFSIRK
jgi:hypothetical protein